MTETMRDVMSEPVEIRGGMPGPTGHGSDIELGGQDEYGAMSYIAGGYSIARVISDSGVVILELVPRGVSEADRIVRQSFFGYADEALAEFNRIKELLDLRGKIQKIMQTLAYGTNILPEIFVPQVVAGNFEVLMVAADYVAEEGDEDAGLLLRAAYYDAIGDRLRIDSPNKRERLIYNRCGIYSAAVATKGGIRTVKIANRLSGMKIIRNTFFAGEMATYGSYNLTYYGPIKSITDKTVTISERGYDAKTRRLTIDQFIGMNSDFILAEVQKRNAEYMD
jgi:hypothetical protein